nr:hemerythrin alpha subunit [Lingula reevii, Peptide Partial, 24 aa] [Lingula reevii]
VKVPAPFAWNEDFATSYKFIDLEH